MSIDATQLCERLRGGGVENANQEAQWMLALAKRKSRDVAELLELLENWTRRRISGEPFQYIVGSVEFYNIELAIGPGVLIPRPETELLVEHALKLLSGQRSGTAVLDLCTGSGAIPLAMAHERPDLDYTGIDLSPEALRWAEENRANLRPPHCRFLQGDLFAPMGKSHSLYRLITANPPYISPEEYRQLPKEIKDFEPRMALEASDDGLALAKRIAEEARQFLVPDGWLLMEIGDTQGSRMREHLQILGYHSVEILRDLAGRDRIARAVWRTC